MKFLYSILLLFIASFRLIFGSSKSFGERLIGFSFNHPLLVMLTLFLGAGSMGVIVTLLFTGPHMTHQNKFLASQSILPGVTYGMVPLEGFPLWPEMMEVIPDTIDDNVLLAGKRAYTLYCRFCHGIKGDGDGPVGRSYIPMPSDLRSDRIQNMTDAQLYNAMLGGIGHEMTTANDTLTILNRIVLPEYRWFIVEYVKSMGNGENRK